MRFSASGVCHITYPELEATGEGAVVSGVIVPALLDADDLVLLASSPAELQRLLARCDGYARRTVHIQCREVESGSGLHPGVPERASGG